MGVNAPAASGDQAWARARRSLAAGVGSAARGTLAGYRVPLFIDRADGPWVQDVDGNRYITLIAGLSSHAPA